MRVGIGYDAHRLVAGRKLVLGGVEVPFELGLEGHSDADVLIHAVMDALLGAAGMRDIGVQFPPEDPQYKDISSLVLLKKVKALLDRNVIDIDNVDAVIVAEQPKLSPFIDEMRRNIRDTLRIELGQVMVKATTTDGLGATGRGEGIAAYAVATVQEK